MNTGYTHVENQRAVTVPAQGPIDLGKYDPLIAPTASHDFKHRNLQPGSMTLRDCDFTTDGEAMPISYSSYDAGRARYRSMSYSGKLPLQLTHMMILPMRMPR